VCPSGGVAGLQGGVAPARLLVLSRRERKGRRIKRNRDERGPGRTRSAQKKGKGKKRLPVEKRKRELSQRWLSWRIPKKGKSRSGSVAGKRVTMALSAGKKKGRSPGKDTLKKRMASPRKKFPAEKTASSGGIKEGPSQSGANCKKKNSPNPTPSPTKKSDTHGRKGTHAPQNTPTFIVGERKKKDVRFNDRGKGSGKNLGEKGKTPYGDDLQKKKKFSMSGSLPSTSSRKKQKRSRATFTRKEKPWLPTSPRMGKEKKERA